MHLYDEKKKGPLLGVAAKGSSAASGTLESKLKRAGCKSSDLQPIDRLAGAGEKATAELFPLALGQVQMEV